MTIHDLKAEIYDIISNGDELLTDEEKVELIIVIIRKWENGGKP